ncbi:Acyl-CoA oxidase [Penicillium macrosclerotiorum]|uniref:Acyl-CoA oxidase n=1 Tax=Penicillium macrosclerotiorum TaxID=303699 RepID=UPI002548C62B|nr:Acyl-CoA oxidase [Penicillium macrosclerotiorum]KAJ5692906.1 Acyl-CoA oxidase [Penicillium macrosclerotiorum]
MPDFTDKLRPSQPDGSVTITREREQSNVSVDELSHYLLSSDGFLERQARILSILLKEPLFSKEKQQNLSRPKRFKLGLARAKLLRRMADKYQWNYDDYKMAEYLVDDVSPYFLHMEMFITTIREQASKEQREFWMPLIESWKIIGAYAQTELGHGSNVRGLELQARWDGHAKEFVLHSPTLTASKWWNGSLGRVANHAIVVAQLLLPKSESPGEYVPHGPHAFIVQVRDMKTHLPRDGVVIGDIGPKYGYITMDNGYMLFNNFRIPHSALLSRYSSVDPQTGSYTKPEQPALVYGSLTYVRANIVHHARLVLARAVTVAVRYTAIRRQFHDRDGDKNGPEMSVLDYPTVRIRILPLLATTFALHYTGMAMRSVYQDTRKDVERGDFRSLAHMHSMSSGLKSLCTMLAADGIETCRRALGGHGFGGGSGLIQLNNDYLSKPTVEGDNWMITQQVAAYLIKKMTSAVQSPDTPGVDETDARFKEFVRSKRSSQTHTAYNPLANDQDIVKSFELRATALAYDVYQQRVLKKRNWNSLLIQLHKLSKAQSQSILVRSFFEALSADNTLSDPVKAVLWDLYRLFAFYTMENDGYEFLRYNAVSQSDLDLLPPRVQELMAQVRPHAVKLVDSWMIPDYLLDSALGRYDGRVYEDLYNRAHRLNPLNRITFNPNYWEEEIIKGTGETGLNILSKL